MYGKLFDSMFGGTLYGHWEAIVTFQQMIVLCDADGIIDMTPQAISARTSIPLEIITKGIGILEAPDPYSRTPDQEGKRIELIDAHRPWGWHIVNHAKYQKLQDADTIREQTRERVRRHRELKRTVTHGNAQKRYTDTDTDTDTNTNTKDQKHVGIAPKNGARHALPDASPVIQTLPLKDGTDFEVRQSFVAVLEPLYPNVDVARTVGEMKGWLLGNKERRKTRRGIKAFVTRWLHNEQQKAEAD